MEELIISGFGLILPQKIRVHPQDSLAMNRQAKGFPQISLIAADKSISYLQHREHRVK